MESLADRTFKYAKDISLANSLANVYGTHSILAQEKRFSKEAYIARKKKKACRIMEIIMEERGLLMTDNMLPAIDWENMIDLIMDKAEEMVDSFDKPLRAKANE